MTNLPTDAIRHCIELIWLQDNPNAVANIASEAVVELKALVADRNLWRKIADDFATAHRKKYGLDGAWDTVNLAYDQAVKETKQGDTQ